VVAALVGIGAFTFGAVAYIAVLYDASSGCEDYGVACRTADPLVAGIEAVLALAALACLGAGAIALVNGGSARRITARLGVGVVLAGVWFGIALTTGP
jgi:hypothetical protein